MSCLTTELDDGLVWNIDQSPLWKSSPLLNKRPQKRNWYCPLQQKYFGTKGAQLGGGHYKIFLGSAICRLTNCESWYRRFWFPTYTAVFMHLQKKIVTSPCGWEAPTSRMSAINWLCKVFWNSFWIYFCFLCGKRNKYKFSFYAVFCTLVVFENVLIFGNNQNKTMASLYPLGVCDWWHSRQGTWKCWLVVLCAFSPTYWKSSFHRGVSPGLPVLDCSSHPSCSGGGYLEAVRIQLNSTPLFPCSAVTDNWNGQTLQPAFCTSRTVIQQASGHVFIIKFICRWLLSWSSWVFDDDSWISSLKGLTVSVEKKKLISFFQSPNPALPTMV